MLKLALLVPFLLISSIAYAADYHAGAATADIAPDFPVRLSGYGSRREETGEVVQRLYVKGLALRHGRGEKALLLAVDTCGISRAIGDEVCARISEKTGVPRARVAINVSHTHSAPMLTGVLPNLFSQPIPPEHQAHIDRYTALLKDAMVQCAVEALGDMAPARLTFGVGKAGFAINRRTEGGPTDHDLPVLCVKNAEGGIMALVAGYACHCTTLQSNHINGDWAGYAQEAMQQAHPGATAMVVIGCGGDQNPHPRGTVELAQQHGQEIAAQVSRVVAAEMRPIDAPLKCRLETMPLAFDTLPTRDELEARAQEESPVGYHARVQLAKLDRGESLPETLPYTMQLWTFGDQLAMLFMAGEVVVDYSLRFKREYDGDRLWVCAYSNDVPCYIPSHRIWTEGGYEGAGAMVYYDQPTRFAPDVEDRIAATVHAMMPRAYRAPK